MAAATATPDRFTAALDDIDVGWTRTDAADLPAVFEDGWDEPIVGAPFPFEDCSLPASIPVAEGPADVTDAATGVTAATMGIADYGSVVIESQPPETELVSLYADTHVAVVRAADLVDSVTEALADLGPRLREGRSNAILATGASATADMGALVQGVHGPGEVHVVIVE